MPYFKHAYWNHSIILVLHSSYALDAGRDFSQVALGWLMVSAGPVANSSMSSIRLVLFLHSLTPSQSATLVHWWGKRGGTCFCFHSCTYSRVSHSLQFLRVQFQGHRFYQWFLHCSRICASNCYCLFLCKAETSIRKSSLMPSVYELVS